MNLSLPRRPPSSLAFTEIVADDSLDFEPRPAIVCPSSHHVLLVGGRLYSRRRLLDLPAPVSVLSLPKPASWSDAQPPHPVGGADRERLQRVDTDGPHHTLRILGD